MLAASVVADLNGLELSLATIGLLLHQELILLMDDRPWCHHLHLGIQELTRLMSSSGRISGVSEILVFDELPRVLAVQDRLLIIAV